VNDREGADLELASYVDAVEAHFRRQRGTETTLSPRDFALAKSWYLARVPLAAVLLGMDRAFESERNVSSLLYCRRRVEDLARPDPGSRAAGPASSSERLSSPDVVEALTVLKDRLLSLPPRTRAAFELPLRRAEEVLDLVGVASRPNWDYVRSKLVEIDEAVSQGALSALPPEDGAALRREAQAAGDRHRGKVDEASLKEAVARLLVARAREALGLPRVSAG
jgi:hypothetical protein